MTDILREYGPLFLGSRLKRLGERMQAGAAKLTSDAGLPVQPAHMSFLGALDGRPMTISQLTQTVGISQPGVTRAIGQLLELGLVQSAAGEEDGRQRTISLTPLGAAVLARARMHVWPRVEAGVMELFGGHPEAFIDQIAALENALDATPLDVLATRAELPLLQIREFSNALAPYFHDINAEWINAMFKLEQTDKDVLLAPREKIIDGGGVILFVEARGLGIVGTCALQKTGERSFELTKMGVREAARGLKAGEFLLEAVIERATALGADPLYLLSNHRCAAAVHLYEKLGFQHDVDIMARYGARYERCDVAMRYAPGAKESAPA